MEKNFGFIFPILLTSVLLQGCAPFKHSVTISYVPQPNVGKIQSAQAVSATVEVDDLRTTEIVGRMPYVTGNINEKPKPIFAANNVADVLKEAIETELKQCGFGTGGNSTVVEVDLLAFDSDLTKGLWKASTMAELFIHIQIKMPDGTTPYSKLISSKGINNYMFELPEGAAQVALNTALQNTVSKLFADPEFIGVLLKSGK